MKTFLCSAVAMSLFAVPVDASVIYTVSGDLTGLSEPGSFSFTVNSNDLNQTLSSSDPRLNGTPLEIEPWYAYSVTDAQVTLGALSWDASDIVENEPATAGLNLGAQLWIEGTPIGPGIGDFAIWFDDAPGSADSNAILIGFQTTFTEDLPGGGIQESNVITNEVVLFSGAGFGSGTYTNVVVEGMTAVPEPSSFVALGLLGIGMAVTEYRRRRLAA